MQYLPRGSDKDDSHSLKYFIDCARITKDQPTTEAWLRILGNLKSTNFEDKNRILLAVLDKGKDVVIKIGESETLEKEYKIGRALHINKIEGFLRYSCFFKCNDDYKEHPSSSRKHLCRGEGTRMSCLVMPYMKHGNMRSFKFRDINNGLLVFKSLLKVIYVSLVKAFETLGLVHNDTHSQNVLIVVKHNPLMHDIQIYGYGAVLMDFENALISSDKTQYQFVYKDYGRLLADIYYTSDLNLTGMMKLMGVVDKHSQKNTKFISSKDDIFRLIDEIEFGAPVNPSLVYDPNIF